MSYRTVGHYEILGQLGAGGMGVVHLARDSRLNRKVALKLLPSELAESPEARQRFTREAQSASALNSPNIVTIYEIGSDGGADFIAMEYIQGETLAEVLRRGVPDIDTMLVYAIQTASALAAAHREGIVHRDVKPGNVMVNQDGLIKVLDFGLAKPAEAGGEHAREGSLKEGLGELKLGLVDAVVQVSEEPLSRGRQPGVDKPAIVDLAADHLAHVRFIAARR